jgi:flagellar protein FlaG
MKVNTAAVMTDQAVRSPRVGQSPKPEDASTGAVKSGARIEIEFPQFSGSRGSHFEENEVKRTIDTIDKILEEKQIELDWSFDRKSNSIVIRFVERDTNKIIRQIPPEEILRLREHIIEMLGMIYDSQI